MKILKEVGIPDCLTCLLKNLYAGQEATVRTGHQTDWFQIGKGVCQAYILSPCLFNLYAEYIMRNAGLDEAQAGIKISGRNFNNLRYAEDTTLMAESEEELKIERLLFLGRKVMTNIDSIFKSRDITLPTKVPLAKAMVFPVVTYGCESGTIKKAEHRRIDAFELWCWRRLLSRLDCKEFEPVHPKGNQSWIFIGRTDAEAETPVLWPPDAKN